MVSSSEGLRQTTRMPEDLEDFEDFGRQDILHTDTLRSLEVLEVFDVCKWTGYMKSLAFQAQLSCILQLDEGASPAARRTPNESQTGIQ